MLNHSLPIKFNRDDSIRWCIQIDNVIFANSFEEHSEGLKIRLPKMNTIDENNPEFLGW